MFFNEQHVRLTSTLLLLFLLNACQLTPKKERPADVENINITNNESIINTVPLMKPSIKSLHSQALEFYQTGELEKAITTLKRAHQIQATPQVSMLLSEISLRQGNYSESFYWSKLATDNGPSKGPICEKLWRILAISSEMLDETDMQLHALEQKEQCLVRQQNRF
jgi:hypothetical protein